MGRKGVFATAVNDISRPGVGFGADDNALQLLFADGRDAELGVRSKLACAIWLLEQFTP
jgi:phosphopantothenoylcysteine synthetase/decarboxylase